MKRPFFLVITGYSLLALTFAVDRYIDGKFCQPEPQEVEIADLLHGELPENYHIRIGKHYRAYSESIYLSGDDEEEFSAVYYPLSESEESMSFSNEIIVFAKTRKIKGPEEIPSDKPYHALPGLISTDRNAHVKEFVEENYPNADPEKIIIVEEGQKPWTDTAIYTFLLACTASLLVFVTLFALSFKQSADDEEPVPQQPWIY